MANRKPTNRPGLPVVLSLLGLGALTLLMYLLVRGHDIILFNPKGYIANEQLKLLIICTGLLLQIGIPTLIIFYFIAWKYREANKTAKYEPETRHTKSFVVFLWGIPTIFMLLMVAVLVPATHRLEPKKPIASAAAPLKVQVVALRWKWLFIYPEQNIATVNYVQLPVNTPVEFDLTADETPMSSFWIPHLAGMLYAMTGHTNRLNMIADTTGEYEGSAAEINGQGFAGMRFKTHVTSYEEFNQWVSKTRGSQEQLSASRYKELLEPSKDNQPAFYSQPLTDLYSNILTKNAGSHEHYAEKE